MDGHAKVAQAAALLRAGQLVAFPTETVYGLGADARNPDAVRRVFAVKGRPADHPLIVHLAGPAFIDTWARDIPRIARLLAETLWPGPLTLILKRAPGVADVVTGGQDTVGLRVPSHPLALELLSAFAGGIAAPSANRYGRISPTTAAHVRQELGAAVPLVLDGGPCGVGIESTIVDLSRGRPRILRPGAVTAAELSHLVGEEVLFDAGEDETGTRPRVSGSLPAHYAPRTPLRLLSPAALTEDVKARIAQGLEVAVLARTARRIHHGKVFWQQAMDTPEAYAHDLYAHLRELDARKAQLILVEGPPAVQEWFAVNDRLERAASGAGEDQEP